MSVKPTRSLLSMFAVFIVLLVAAGPAAASDSGVPATYVANYGAWSVTEYAAGVSGDVAPLAEIGGTKTALYYPSGLTVGQDGTVYVTNYNDSVTVYAKGANGNVAPIRTLSGPDTGLAKPRGIALDAAGHLFVANYGNGSVTEYAKGADTDDAPIATIKGPQTRLQSPASVTIAPDGEIVVGDGGPTGGDIVRFKPGANGDVAPVSRLQGGGLDPEGVALTASGDLIVADPNSDSVKRFAKGAVGNARPTEIWDQGVQNPYDVAITSQGDVLAADYSHNAVVTLRPGSPAPVGSIVGHNNTDLNEPVGVAVLPTPTPPAAPTIGEADPRDRSATVAFEPPTAVGAGPITSYTATAKDLTDPARGGQTANDKGSPITVTGLTNGDTYTFTVTAMNVVGAGPASAPSNGVIPGSASLWTDTATPATAGDQPSSLAFSPGGQWAATANRGGGSISMFGVGKDGIPAPVNGSPFEVTGPVNPTAVAFSPDGTVLAAVGPGDSRLNSDGVSLFQVRADGKLSGESATGNGTRPEAVAFSPGGHLLATANENGTVSMYSIDGQFLEQQVPGSPFAVGLHPTALAFSPDGHLLTIANRGGDSISVFVVGTDGQLTAAPGSPFMNDGRAPVALAFTPDGALLATANDGQSANGAPGSVSGSVSLFRVDPDGKLTRTAQTDPFAAPDGSGLTGIRPESLAFNPAINLPKGGTWLAVGVNHGPPRIFRIDLSAGSLTPEKTAFSSAASSLVAFSPTYRPNGAGSMFFLGVNSDSGRVTAYRGRDFKAAHTRRSGASQKLGGSISSRHRPVSWPTRPRPGEWGR